MSSEGNPILGVGRSTSPTGVGSDPTPMDNLLSKAPTWYKGDAYRAEYARLYQLKKEAVERLLNCYDELRRAKEPAVSEDGTRRPVGARAAPAVPSKAPASSSGAHPAFKVLGSIYLGEHLEPAQLVAWPVPLPETEFEGMGLDTQTAYVQMAERRMFWTKKHLDNVTREMLALIELVGNELTRIHADQAAISQWLGRDKDAEVRRENAKSALAVKLREEAATSKRREGELSDEDAAHLAEGLAEAQMILEDDDPAVEALIDQLRRHEKHGDLFVGYLPRSVGSEESRAYLMRPLPDQNGVRIHIVAPRQNLWMIAEKYYGNPNEWPRIAEANRDLIKNPHVIQPDWKLKIPPQK